MSIVKRKSKKTILSREYEPGSFGADIIRFTQSIINSDNDRSLNDLDSVLINVTQLNLTEMSSDAQEAMIEILQVEIQYLNGSIIQIEAEDAIKNLIRRAKANRSFIGSVATPLSVAIGATGTISSYLFYDHWNNIQSIITGMSDLVRQEGSYSITALAPLVKVFADRPEIQYYFTGGADWTTYFYTLIKSAPIDNSFLIEKINDQIPLIHDESQSSINSWLGNVVNVGVDFVSSVSTNVMKNFSNRSDRVYRDMSNKVDDLIYSCEHGLDIMNRLIMVLICSIMIILIYKMVNNRFQKNRFEDAKRNLEEYNHSFSFRKYVPEGTQSPYDIIKNEF